MIGTCEIVPDIVSRLTEIVGDIYRMAYDRGIAARKMHQTTVRFGEDLWQALEEECERLGVSIAQYLREAALTRLVYAAGRRGDDEFELALSLISGAKTSDRDLLEAAVAPVSVVESVRARASRESSEAAALAAQGRVVRQRARELRERAEQRRLG